MKKVAFVVQRCGPEVVGGAESLCYQVAKHMTGLWDVEILTTCALDYMTWADHYPAGTVRDDGIRITRFPVDHPRDVESFNAFSQHVAEHRFTLDRAEQDEWIRRQGPVSSALLQAIQDRRDEFDAFIFVTYLYATTCLGLPLVRDKAWLLSAAHDEWPIYLSFFDELFRMPRGIIYNAVEEELYVHRRFKDLAVPGAVVGIGVDLPESPNAERFRAETGIREPFLLYAGRVTENKGCDVLFDHFLRLRQEENTPRKLVLIGKAVMPVPEHPDIIQLGFVSEQTKFDAMAACDWLVNPSPYESLSIVILEAWAAGRPVLVTEGSEVMVGQCRRSNGGLWYANYEEFSHIIGTIDEGKKHLLARQGREFVVSTYSWPAIARKMDEFLSAT